jgi:hypothetical protein
MLMTTMSWRIRVGKLACQKWCRSCLYQCEHWCHLLIKTATLQGYTLSRVSETVFPHLLLANIQGGSPPPPTESKGEVLLPWMAAGLRLDITKSIIDQYLVWTQYCIAGNRSWLYSSSPVRKIIFYNEWAYCWSVNKIKNF